MIINGQNIKVKKHDRWPNHVTIMEGGMKYYTIDLTDWEECLICKDKIYLGVWYFGIHYMDNKRIFINGESKFICHSCSKSMNYIRMKFKKLYGLSKENIKNNPELIVNEFLKYQIKKQLKIKRHENIKTS